MDENDVRGGELREEARAALAAGADEGSEDTIEDDDDLDEEAGKKTAEEGVLGAAADDAL